MRYISLICFIQVTSSALTSSPYNRLLDERRAAKVNKATATGLTASRAQKRTTAAQRVSIRRRRRTSWGQETRQPNSSGIVLCAASPIAIVVLARAGLNANSAIVGRIMRAQKVARVMCVTTASRTVAKLARNLLLL